jgi:hypothetical protein
MKKFIIWYLIISILIAVAIYFMTLTLSYNQRVYDVFYELAEESVEIEDFDRFVSMQSIAYNRLSRQETDDYIVDVYLTIAQAETEYRNQFALFVLPKTDVTYATSVEDENDQTGLRVINNETSETVYETYTESSYEGAAVSYGLDLMGFYFYAFDITEDLDLEIELYDYDGVLIIEFDQLVQYETYPDLSDDFNQGISDEDLEILIDQDTYVYPKLIQNMTIFIVADILLGSIIYFIIKYKKR